MILSIAVIDWIETLSGTMSVSIVSKFPSTPSILSNPPCLTETMRLRMKDAQTKGRECTGGVDRKPAPCRPALAIGKYNCADNKSSHADKTSYAGALLIDFLHGSRLNLATNEAGQQPYDEKNALTALIFAQLVLTLSLCERFCRS